MAMRALNVQIDEELYERIRTISFINKQPMAVVVREFLQDKVNAQPQKMKQKLTLVLDAKDEKRIRKILAEDDWISQEEFDKKFGFDSEKF